MCTGTRKTVRLAADSPSGEQAINEIRKNLENHEAIRAEQHNYVSDAAKPILIRKRERAISEEEWRGNELSLGI